MLGVTCKRDACGCGLPTIMVDPNPAQTCVTIPYQIQLQHGTATYSVRSCHQVNVCFCLFFLFPTRLPFARFFGGLCICCISLGCGPMNVTRCSNKHIFYPAQDLLPQCFTCVFELCKQHNSRVDRTRPTI